MREEAAETGLRHSEREETYRGKETVEETDIKIERERDIVLRCSENSKHLEDVATETERQKYRKRAWEGCRALIGQDSLQLQPIIDSLG